MSQTLSSRAQVGPGGNSIPWSLLLFHKLFKSAFFFRASSDTSQIINGTEESLGLANNAYLANMGVSEWSSRV